MEKHIFTAETKMEAINEAKKTLVETENNLIIEELKKSEEEVTISVIEKREILDFIKEYLTTLLTNMGYTSINIEIKNKDITPVFTIYSENDSLLIGKGGKNLQALQTISGMALKKELNLPFKYVININNYQEKRDKNLEHLAYQIAKEVRETKVAVTMDNMNSYERRIIHNALSNNRYVYTESVGVEPNRHLVVKPKEEA